MSPSGFRQRAGLATAALVAGAPLFGAGAAFGAPVESGQSVTFRKNSLLSVSCGATPDTRSVTIPAESTLQVVNATGYRATLLLDGSPRGEITKGGTAEVLFRRGPVVLGLKPHCMISEAATIRVQVSRVSREAPAGPAPAGPGSSTGGGRTTVGGSPAVNGNTQGATRTAPERSGGQPAGPGGGSPGTVPAEPDAEGVIGDSTAAPELLGGPDGESGDGNLAAEPLGSVEPLTNRGPIGLLATIAILCVIGVTIGSMRAILAQRASRASVALR